MDEKQDRRLSFHTAPSRVQNECHCRFNCMSAVGKCVSVTDGGGGGRARQWGGSTDCQHRQGGMALQTRRVPCILSVTCPASILTCSVCHIYFATFHDILIGSIAYLAHSV